MVRCIPTEEPADFDAQIRNPGRNWLRQHRESKARPYPYWRRCHGQLARAFDERCAYTAMFLGAPGTADHFVSIEENRDLAYEWRNYRYAAGWINSRKQALSSKNLLDPFAVGEGWFEMLLPSLQLRVSERCPPKHRALAENTLVALGLRDDERVVRYRRGWLEEYERGEIELDYLAKKAPLLAQAVQRWEDEYGRRWGQPSPKPKPARARKSTRRRRSP